MDCRAQPYLCVYGVTSFLRRVVKLLCCDTRLHARALIIPRENGKPIKIVAPLPPHMKQTFEALGFLEQEAGKDPLAPFV